MFHVTAAIALGVLFSGVMCAVDYRMNGRAKTMLMLRAILLVLICGYVLAFMLLGSTLNPGELTGPMQYHVHTPRAKALFFGRVLCGLGLTCGAVLFIVNTFLSLGYLVNKTNSDWQGGKFMVPLSALLYVLSVLLFTTSDIVPTA